MYDSKYETRIMFGFCERAVTDEECEALGYQWASSLLAFIALSMTPFRRSLRVLACPSTMDELIWEIAILFFKFGKRLRGKSRFAQA